MIEITMSREVSHNLEVLNYIYVVDMHVELIDLDRYEYLINSTNWTGWEMRVFIGIAKAFVS